MFKHQCSNSVVVKSWQEGPTNAEFAETKVVTDTVTDEDSLELSSLHQAMVKAVEELNFIWPECLPVTRFEGGLFKSYSEFWPAPGWLRGADFSLPIPSEAAHFCVSVRIL
jgi:hypothetical protein